VGQVATTTQPGLKKSISKKYQPYTYKASSR